MNLADMAKAAPRDNRTTVRRTLPIPAARNGVKLGRPTPVTDEAGEAPHARASDRRRDVRAHLEPARRTCHGPPAHRGGRGFQQARDGGPGEF